MQILKNTQAHPAHIHALGRSLHYQLHVCKLPLSRDRFLEKYGVAKTDRVKDTLRVCEEALGIVQENAAEDCLEFADGWDTCFAPDATRHALMLRINSLLQKDSESSRDSSLYALCERILQLPVLGHAMGFPKLIDQWEKHGGSPIKDQESQRNDAQRWMIYLGWARRFGDKQYVPDLTRWWMAWCGAYRPSGRQALSDAWDEWCRALPPLAGIDREGWLPESVGVALSGLERRGLCRFTSESDSVASPLQWRLGSEARTERSVHWTVGEAAS